MLDRNTVHDAAIRDCVNSLFPMAYEQRSWHYNVFVILCIRCRFTNVRIQTFNVSVLKNFFYLSYNDDRLTYKMKSSEMVALVRFPSKKFMKKIRKEQQQPSNALV